MPETFLTVAELMAELHCSRSSVYRLIHRGRLPQPVQLLGRSVWRRSEVEEAKSNLAQGLRRRPYRAG